MKQSLFHILTQTEADEAKAQGSYTPANFAAEGFIHCSYAAQICPTAERFYKGQSNLVLLEIDESALSSEVIVEDLYGSGEAFPHIYGTLLWQAVVAVHDFPCLEDGSFELPEAIKL